MVIPFAKCIARPDSDALRHLLSDHLLATAAATGEFCGPPERRLAFLAGLMHDVGKCHVEWQEYIDPKSSRRRGPPHAPFGAAMFAFAAEQLIPRWVDDRATRKLLRNRMADWTLAIYGHHGRLPDLSGICTPWDCPGTIQTVHRLLAGCDIGGMIAFAQEFFPDLQARQRDIQDWLGQYGDQWAKLVLTLRRKIVSQSPHEQHCQLAMDFADRCSRLYAADRTNAAGLGMDRLDCCTAQAALSHLERSCQEEAGKTLAQGGDGKLVSLRSEFQQAAAARYLADQTQPFYTLLLPTGYGKTLTALRVALEACASDRCNRIVYVAPYISILSQAAGDIAAATGLEVFEHHHLSLAQRFDPSQAASRERQTTDHLDDDDFDILDTWQTPVLATTFNQFFRAVFPRRAQQTLRSSALENAFVIIDEPQIIDVTIWNVFLRGLDAFCASHGCQVLFATATLPLTDVGLIRPPAPLAEPAPALGRYVVQTEMETLDRESLTLLTLETLRATSSIAVVLNTVRDAAAVYASLQREAAGEGQLLFLSAMMLPGHKHQIIRQIASQLRRLREGEAAEKVIVVSTQVLEAGVNLSFQSILRSRSILPSILQTAGRANRHNEGPPACVRVFPFALDGEHELRRFVYRDRTARTMTDRILQQHRTLDEVDTAEVLAAYFADCMAESKHEAGLTRFTDAAFGEWSRLADIEPFGINIPSEEVFVPVPLADLDQRIRPLVEYFAPQDSIELLERYLDPASRKDRDFRESKLMNMAVRQFIVPTRQAVAERVAERLNDWLWLIRDPSFYSSETGLAHWLLDEAPDDTPSVIF